MSGALHRGLGRRCLSAAAAPKHVEICLESKPRTPLHRPGAAAGTPAAAQLESLIRVRGPISFATFMQHALGLPGHGYYARGVSDARDLIGRAGDFVTAPEIAPGLFAELIAMWVASMVQSLVGAFGGALGGDFGGAPEISPGASPGVSPRIPPTPGGPVSIIELGPGLGTVAGAITRILRRIGVARTTRLHLVERSPGLRARQRAATAAGGHPDVSFFDSLEECLEATAPAPFVLVANEFLDALPVYRFERSPEDLAWRELLVDLALAETPEAATFRTVRSPTATPALVLLDVEPFRSRIAAASGLSRIEICPAAVATAQAIARAMETRRGAALIIDYGTAGPDRGPPADTVRAIYRHATLTPYERVGEADLSADVDFGAITADGVVQPRVVGLKTQGELLRDLGIEAQLAKALREIHSEEFAVQQCQQFTRVVEEMGKTYWALGMASSGVVVDGF